MILCCLRFIIIFVVKNNFLELQNHQKLILRPIFKFPHTALKILSAQISGKDFSFKAIFPVTLSFFHDYKTTHLGVIFSPKKLHFIRYTFLQIRFFNFNTILKTCFKHLFRKTVKNFDFTLLNKPLQSCKLP